MIRVRSPRALEFACHSKACAPPPTGSGGSKASGGGGYAKSYASDKLKRSGSAGDELSTEWSPSPDGLTLRGVVTTKGGRKFAVEWDEFDVGPKAANQIIKHYGKLLDTYPEVRAVPLAIGTDAAVNIFKKVFDDDPYNVAKIRQMHQPGAGGPTGYVINSASTSAPLMMAYTAKIDMGRGLMTKNPKEWGAGVQGLNNDQAREYIVSHEFGHVVQQQALSQMSPGQKAVLSVRHDVQREEAPGKGIVDVGSYALSKNQELFAESFAIQTHGLQTKDSSFLRDVTDPYTGGAPVRTVDWSS